MNRWIDVRDAEPPTKEPVVYARPNLSNGKWHVGIAYWTVSDRWMPEMHSSRVPEGYGFTHWMPLPVAPHMDLRREDEHIKRRTGQG